MRIERSPRNEIRETSNALRNNSHRNASVYGAPTRAFACGNADRRANSNGEPLFVGSPKRAALLVCRGVFAGGLRRLLHRLLLQSFAIAGADFRNSHLSSSNFLVATGRKALGPRSPHSNSTHLLRLHGGRSTFRLQSFPTAAPINRKSTPMVPAGPGRYCAKSTELCANEGHF